MRACRASLSLWPVPSTELSLFHPFCSALGVYVCVWSQGWRRAELVARLVGSGIQNLFFCEACDGSLQQATQEMVRGIDLNVFFGEFPCCTVRHAGHLRCDREKLRTPMLGIFAHYVQDRMSDQGANAGEATERVLLTELIEQDRERMFPSVFQFETTHNNVTSSSEVRKLFGPLLKMVEQRIRASGAHNALMTRSDTGTAGVEGVTDLDLSSTTISEGGQRTSASAWTNYSESKGSASRKGLHDNVAQELAKASRARAPIKRSS